MVGKGVKERLLGGGTAPQGKAADAVMIKVDFAAHQAMEPVLAYGKVLAEQVHVAVLVGAANEDHLSAKRRMQVDLKVLGHRSARRGRFGSLATTSSVRGDGGIRTCLQFAHTAHAVALPDLGLPQTVEALDAVLHPVLQRQHEHRNHPQRQTQATDAAHRVSELVRPLKHGVVVILGIRGQPVTLPAREQAGAGALGAQLQEHPGIGQCPMQALGG